MTPALSKLYCPSAATVYRGHRSRVTVTCGKDDIPGNQFVVNDGKLRELDSRHPRHGGVSSFPIELDVICGVSICGREHGKARPGLIPM